MKYSLDELQSVTQKLTSVIAPKDIIGINGPLGAGKTTLIKALCSHWDIPTDEVTSPTYVYHHIYEGKIKVHHMDLYRIESEDILQSLDLVSFAQGNDVTFVEWMELYPDAFGSYLEIQIEILNDQDRELSFNLSRLSIEDQMRFAKVL